VTQPDYVPLAPTDRVRPSARLPAARSWRAERPGELVDLAPPKGGRFGLAGPDLGYGLKLARRFVDRLQLAEGESPDDALAGAFACAAKRAASFGRAPVIHDAEWAYTLWGLLGDAPGDLVAHRLGLFRGAAHHYWDQREIVDSVSEDALALTPAQVRARLGDWRRLIAA